MCSDIRGVRRHAIEGEATSAMGLQTNTNIVPTTLGLSRCRLFSSFSSSTSSFSDSASDSANADNSKAFPSADHPWHPTLPLPLSPTDGSKDDDEALIQPSHAFPPSTDWNEEGDDFFSESLQFLKGIPMPIDFYVGLPSA